MLKVEQISTVRIHTDEWRQKRLAKFTSSMYSTLMGDKPETVGAITYIHERVGEELTGQPCNTEVITPATDHGLLYESDAIKKFGEHRQIPFLVTQVFVNSLTERNGSTPDAIVPINKYSDAYDVETVEVKCYPSYGHYIKCALCSTHQQIKTVDPKLYYQVLHQIDTCGALRGWAVIYHPAFRVGGLRIIPFRTIELSADLKILKQRQDYANKKFEEVRDKLLNLKN